MPLSISDTLSACCRYVAAVVKNCAKVVVLKHNKIHGIIDLN